MTKAKRRTARRKKSHRNEPASGHSKPTASKGQAQGLAGAKGADRKAHAPETSRRPASRGGAGPLSDAVTAPRYDHLTRDGIRVSYYADGPGHGRPLVLIHAINAAPSAFELKPLFEHYRSQRRVYALELPGFGFSERSDRCYSPTLFSETIADFVSRAIGEPVDALALSLGSEFTAGAALRAPDLFATLTFISPTGFSRRNLPNGQGKVARWAHKVLSVPLWGSALFRLLGTRPSIRYYMKKSFVGRVPDEYIEYAYATAHQPGAHHAPLYFLSGQLFTHAARDALYGKLTQPVLVIRDRDPYVAFDRLPALIAERANWQEELVAPSLGLPHWERLAETTAVLDRFWAAHDGGPASEPEPTDAADPTPEPAGQAESAARGTAV